MEVKIMKKLFVVLSLLCVAPMAQARLGGYFCKKVAKPVAHMGAAAVEAPCGRCAMREFVDQGMEELAAWAEGRPAVSAADRKHKKAKRDAKLKKAACPHCRKKKKNQCYCSACYPAYGSYYGYPYAYAAPAYQAPAYYAWTPVYWV